MDRYIAEIDEANSITALWIMKETARGPSVFDPRKHKFDPQRPAEFSGAPREEIVSWLDTKNQRS